MFLIIGRNKPKTYNKIIINETINIALTELIFMSIIFLLILEIVQQNCKAYDLYQVGILEYHPMRL